MKVSWLPLIAGLGLLCLAVAPLFDTKIVVFDILSHFPLQAALAAAGIFVVSLPLWKRTSVRWGLVALLCAALGNGAWLQPYWVGDAMPEEAVVPDITIVQLNLQKSNRNFATTVDWVQRAKPDVFVALEVDKGWKKALAQLLEILPHHVAHPRGDNYGLAVYSRFPILHRKEISLPVYPAPAYLLRLNVAGRVVRLGAFHTLPPQSQELMTARNLSLDEIGQWAVSEPGTPTLVVGDLNITPFAAPFRTFLADASLMDPRAGRGLRATWPSPLPPVLRIPIDYILHNGHLRALSLTTGRPVGSDHTPLVGAFKFVK